ncbi:MupA/Atu3671 family FMN-dependent luciferase-like monooxygenase [Gaopeijia maritima]|uniref:MupA/Atu3671 family FMN-dependent luciferase-like monooxygenase n=1 Tax=Gaopeijia maritima TaxID=3119007 RepID=UPI0032732C51
MSDTTFRCYVIGSDTLLQECTDHLLSAGHTVRGVVTDTERIADWARERGLEVIAPEGDWVDRLRTEPFDHLFAITWLKILPDEVLALPRGRAVNFHDGPLPAWAGLNAPAWALMGGVDRYGIVWHEMTSGVDRGDILVRETIEVADDETSLSLNTKCFAAARDSFPRLVAGLASGSLRGEAQDPARRSYFGRHDRPDHAGFLDWRRPASELHARVRALDFGPYPNPLGRPRLLDASGRSWLVTAARAEPGDAPVAAGTVVRADAAGVAIGTAEGLLVVTGLQDAWGRPVDSPASALPAGTRLPALADAAALDEAVRTAARTEAFWTRRLGALDPAVVPDLAESGAPADTPPSEPLVLPLPSAPPAALLAALAVVSARLGRREAGDLGWWEPGADPTVFSPWRPLRVDLDAGAPFAALTGAAEAAIAEVRERGPFPTDLASRRPGAPAPAMRPEGPPLAVGVDLAARSGDDLPPVRLSLSAAGGPARLVVDPARLPERTARALAGAITALLADAAARPDAAWSALSLVDDAARRHLLGDLAGPDTPVGESFVHERFEARAAAEPDRPALRVGGRRISYGELDRRANAVAHRLRELGVGPDAIVGVYVERSIELMVATLGVLKAGGAYLPLDPDFPADRVAFMLADAQAPVVLIHGARPGELDEDTTTVVDLDDLGTADAAPPRGELRTDHLAYVIYTSGSTGRPKGVLVEHRNVANFFAGMDGVVEHDPPGLWMAVTSLSFDISVLELFWTLARGFEVVILVDRTASDRAEATASARLEQRGMQFGLFMWGNDDGPGRDKYRLMLDAGRYLDQNGFDSVWTPERHFHAFGGPFPNPSVTSAALAAVTEKLAIRSGSCVSPLHHPIRIAEEWAVVDNLSNGRVGLSFAAGWQPNDFVLRPESFPNQKQVMMDQIDLVRRLWRGEAVEFTNPAGKPVSITTLPRPVQAELPFWVTTAGNPDSYRRAGAMGANVLTHLLGQSIDEVAEKIAIYREARAEAGFDPEGGTVTLMLHTFVGDDDDQVREWVREPMKDYLRASMKLVLGFAWSFPAFKRPGGADSTPDDIDLSSLTEEENEAILDFAFDRYYETSGLFGTPSSCVDMVARCAGAGVDEIACLLDFGVDTDLVMDSLPLLKEVRDRSNAAFEGSAGAADAASHPEPGADRSVAEWLREGVSHLQCTPSMARMFLDQDDVQEALGGLDQMMVGGEAFPEQLAEQLRRVVPGRVTNMYGPTETTIWSTTHDVDRDGPVPIGRPIANTTIRLLDPQGGLVPPGVPGELCIGGLGVVRGYHARPELTAERFIADPYGAPGERIYRTGDLARWDEHGVLEFLGRIDQQVKVRGYRIEPGEIEALLEARDEVTRATVVLREDTPGDQRLVGYLVVDGPVDADELRRFLGESLPSYMVPAHLVTLDRLPLTPNGKIDRKALPAPRDVAVRTQPVVAPSTPLESTLVQAWIEVLGVPEIGTEDNFFDAGGHSLLVVQLHRILTERIDRPLSLVDLYRFPTIRSLAEHLSAEAPATEALDESAARGARRREMMRRRRGG